MSSIWVSTCSENYCQCTNNFFTNEIQDINWKYFFLMILQLKLLNNYGDFLFQEKAAYEIKCVIGEKCKQLTLADIYKLEYLDMCVKDILRLFPIAPFIIKRVTEEYQIGRFR